MSHRMNRVERGPGGPASTTETYAATIKADSGASDKLKYNANGTEFEVATLTHTQTLLAKSVQGAVASEIVITTKVVTAAESGKTFFLTLAGGFNVTLPALAQGLKYRFIVAVAPTTSYTITSAAGDDIVGGQHDAGGAAGDVESTAGADVITFVANQSVVGDWVEIVSNGTLWFARAFSNIAAGVTFTG